MDVAHSGGLDHQFARGVDLDRGLGVLYLVVDVLSALWVELTGLVVLVPQKEILAMRE